MKKLIFIFSLIFINSAFAQLSLSLSAGFDTKEISLYNYTALDGNNAYWNNGITFGANLDFSLSEKMLISILLHYSSFKFDKYVNNGFTIPEIRFLYADGENSKMWRTSVEVKYFPFPQSRFKFFIFSGLGISTEELGTIKTYYSDINQVGNQFNIIDSVNKKYLVHSLGLGVRIKIISNLFIDLTGSYYSNYDEIFQTFFGLNVGYQIL